MDINTLKESTEKAICNNTNILLIGDHQAQNTEFVNNVLTLDKFSSITLYEEEKLRIHEEIPDRGAHCTFIELETEKNCNVLDDNIVHLFSLQSEDKNILCYMVSQVDVQTENKLRNIIENVLDLNLFSRIVFIMRNINEDNAYNALGSSLDGKILFIKFLMFKGYKIDVHCIMYANCDEFMKIVNQTKRNGNIYNLNDII
jgi:hypothetical protein